MSSGSTGYPSQTDGSAKSGAGKEEIRRWATNDLGLHPHPDRALDGGDKVWLGADGKWRVRIDIEGHPTFSDPKARVPHFHLRDENQNDITVDGNKHIPL